MAKDDKLDGFMTGPGSKVLWNSFGKGSGDAASPSTTGSAGESANSRTQIKEADLVLADVKAFNVRV
jgi:hypothetical protein